MARRILVVLHLSYPAAVDKLLTRLCEAQEPSLRASAAFTCADIPGKRFDHVIDAMHFDPDPLVRQSWAYYVGRQAGGALPPELVGALNDSNEGVVNVARAMLAQTNQAVGGTITAALRRSGYRAAAMILEEAIGSLPNARAGEMTDVSKITEALRTHGRATRQFRDRPWPLESFTDTRSDNEIPRPWTAEESAIYAETIAEIYLEVWALGEPHMSVLILLFGLPDVPPMSIQEAATYLGAEPEDVERWKLESFAILARSASFRSIGGLLDSGILDE